MTSKHPSTVNLNSTSTQQLDFVRSFIDAVNALSLETSFKNVSALIDENGTLRKQIDAKDEEIKKLDTVKEMAYNEMFEANHRERGKHTELLKQVNMLNTTVREKEDVIATQITTINDRNQQIQTLKDLYEKEQKTVALANKDMDELREDIKQKEAYIDELKTGGSKIKKKCKTLETTVKSLEESKESLEERLHEDSAKLQELQGYVATYCEDEEKVLLNRFFSLWEFASHELVVHLKDNLPAENLQNHQAWKKLKMPNNMPHQVPLPPSNSDAAKQMRLAVFLGIFAREINQQIFQPVYLSSDDNSVREILTNLAMKDCKKESFCRAMLLSVDPEKQLANLRERKKTVIRNVELYLKDLFLPTQFQGVQMSLEGVVESAAKSWNYFQHAVEKYEPDFEPLEWDDDEWDAFPFADDMGAPDGQASSSEIDGTLLTIFPRICRVKDNVREPLSFVTVLRRSQCVAADREYRRKESSNSGCSRIASDRHRPRGMSISLGNTNGQQRAFLHHTNHSGDGEPNK